MASSRLIRDARTAAGLTQTELARRSGTSQATLSAYENSERVPSASTLERILAAAGWRLASVPATRPVHHPNRADIEERGRILAEVLALADALPFRRTGPLRYPPLKAATGDGPLNLSQRLLAVHSSLDAAGLPHAFGGAIALAYWTREPRGTRDLDVNVFISPEDCETALAALPQGVSYGEADVETIKRDGQTRLAWDDTPVDLFFSNLPIHDEAERHRRQVPFEGEEIPILGALELGVFKVMFDRTRDWADIEAMLEAGTLDVDALRERVTELVGDGDPRVARIEEAVRQAERERGDG